MALTSGRYVVYQNVGQARNEIMSIAEGTVTPLDFHAGRCRFTGIDLPNRPESFGISPDGLHIALSVEKPGASVGEVAHLPGIEGRPVRL